MHDAIASIAQQLLLSHPEQQQEFGASSAENDGILHAQPDFFVVSLSLLLTHIMLRRLTLDISRVSHLSHINLETPLTRHGQRSFVSTTRHVRVSPKTWPKKDDSIKKEDATVDNATMAAARELVDNNVGPFPATDAFDQPFQEASSAQDWSRSFHGLSTQPFPKEIAEVLQQPIAPDDVEITPGMARSMSCNKLT